MTDINRRLQYNSTSQKEAKLAAEYLELDRQGKEIEERVQVRITGSDPWFAYMKIVSQALAISL